MTPFIKSAELPNGVVLSYAEQGNESGVPVILLHGVTDSWRSFELVLPLFSRSIHAFAVTQRGHGDSSHPQSGYSFSDFAGDLAAFMEVAKIEKAVIVGHSMGSSVAQRFAIDHSERVRGLVLVGSFASMRGNPVVQEFWDSTVSKITDPVDPGLVRAFQESTINSSVPAEFYEMVVLESLKVPARVWLEAFGGFPAHDLSGELGKIKAPTLIVWGEQDAFCPRADQDTLKSSISGSRLVVYSGTGHAVHWEQPRRFVSDLEAFISGLD
jgi:non-heme chloroperoxidase